MNWPSTLVPYHRTPTFDNESVPPNLLSQHTTKAGVWAMLRVVQGKLDFVDDTTGGRLTLEPQRPGFIEPEREHHIELEGEVRFYLEFYRDATVAPDSGPMT